MDMPRKGRVILKPVLHIKFEYNWHLVIKNQPANGTLVNKAKLYYGMARNSFIEDTQGINTTTT